MVFELEVLEEGEVLEEEKGSFQHKILGTGSKTFSIEGTGAWHRAHGSRGSRQQALGNFATLQSGTYLHCFVQNPGSKELVELFEKVTSPFEHFLVVWHPCSTLGWSSLASKQHFGLEQSGIHATLWGGAVLREMIT